MDWKREATDELREYIAMQTAVQNLRDDIAQIKAEATRLGCTSFDRAMVSTAETVRDEKIINLIIKLEKLQLSLKYTLTCLAKVERGLASLSEDERRVLHQLYICPQKNNVDKLCEELGIERSSVYRWRDKALHHYTLARYGCTTI